MYCGHGHDVSAVTQTLREFMHQNINLWDQSEFMGGLNIAFNKSKQYATAVILSFHRITGRPHSQPTSVWLKVLDVVTI